MMSRRASSSFPCPFPLCPIARVRFDTDNNRVTPLMFTVQYCGIVRLRREEPWARFGATIQELIRGGADGEARGFDDCGTALTL